MRKLLSALAIVTAAVLLAPGTATAADQTAADQTAADRTVAEFETGQQAAWNAHDAGAYTAAFDTSAEIVTSLGWHWTGQAAAASNLRDGFKFVYAHSQLRIGDVQVRVLTPELAAVTLSWSIDGARAIDGGLPAGAQHGFETQLLQRVSNGWLILVQQDTAAAALPAPSSSAERAPAPAAAFPVTAPPQRRCIFARANGDCLIYGKAKPAPAR